MLFTLFGLMWGFLPLIIFISIIKKMTHDSRHSDAFKFILFLIIASTVLSSVNPGFIGIAILAIIYKLIKKNNNKKKDQQRSEKYGWNVSDLDKKWENSSNQADNVAYTQDANYERNKAGSYNTDSFGKKGKGNSSVLPRSVSKRKKVLSSFNEKYDLYLTDEQMQSIVNSSYMSEIWKVELEAMTLKYETIYEWFQGKTDWLRAYMYVFHVQEITSDIRQQEKICVYAYEEVFRYVDELGSIPLYEKVQKVNSRFLTSFDDVSFMIAYRFLERKGLYHELESPDLVRNETEIDELLEKYKTSPAPSQK